MQLTKFDKNDSEREESARIIIQALADKQDFENAIGFLVNVKNAGFGNYNDLRSALIGRYTAFCAKKHNDNKGRVDNEVYVLTLKIDGLYDAYLIQQKKIKNTTIFFGVVVIIFIIVVFLTRKIIMKLKPSNNEKE